MPKVLVTEDYLTDIANSIRAKLAVETTYKPSEMSEAINSINNESTFDNEIHEFTQINDEVSSYLEEANTSYTNDNYSSVSVASSYLNSEQTTWERPLYYSIPVSGGTIYLQDETTGVGRLEEISSGTYLIYNLIPERVYRYIVMSSNGDITESGRVRGTGSLRMIYAPSSVHNFRDLGGWETAYGTLKYGLIYRGAQLNYYSDTSGAVYDLVNSQGINWLLNSCGVRCEIDLRTEAQTTGMSESVLGDTVEYSRFPMSVSSYEDIVKLSGSEIENTVGAIKSIMNNVTRGLPTYIHCQAGSDRTACICYLLEAILGVEQYDCDKDYELTTFYYGGQYYRHRDDASRWVPIVTYINSLGGDTLEGNAIQWCQNAGISETLLNRFRAAMIDGTPSTITYYYTVTQNLTGVSLSNTATTAHGSYSTTITINDNLTLASVTVTMGGTDITDECYNSSTQTIEIEDVTGDIVITVIASANYHSITLNLYNCSGNNSISAVEDGHSYNITLTPNNGFELTEENIVVTSNGTEIDYSLLLDTDDSTAVYIPSVTGDIVITATATLINMLKIAVDTDGLLYNNGNGYMEGYCLNSSGNVVACEGVYVTGFMPIQVGSHVEFENVLVAANNTVENCTYNYIAVYDAEFNLIKAGYTYYLYNNKSYNNTISYDGDYIDSFDLYRVNANGDCDGCVYVRFSANEISEDSAIYIYEG